MREGEKGGMEGGGREGHVRVIKRKMVDNRTHVTDRYLRKWAVMSSWSSHSLQIQHEARERYTTTRRNLMTQ